MANEPELGPTETSDLKPSEAKRVPPEGTIPNERLGSSLPAEPTASSPAADAPSSISSVTEGSGDQTQPGVTLQESPGHDADGNYGAEYHYDVHGTGQSDYSPYAPEASASDQSSDGGGTPANTDAPPAGAPADEPASSDEEGGGPVKPFLEHLEDLRWTLVKSVSTLFISMLICLVAGNYLIAFLLWPVKQAERIFQRNRTDVPLVAGTNVLARVQMADFGGTNRWGTNKLGSLHVVPVSVGTNVVLALEPHFGKSDVPPPSMVVIKNYGPVEGIMVALKLALFGGLILASPLVFFFVGQFVLPALRVTEKRILYVAVAYGSGLFLLGLAFCYMVVMVFAIGATVEFSNWLGFGADEWRADAYISFVVKFMLAMGLAFELPVVILVLVKIGILDYAKLKSWRQWAIVGNLVVAAFMTPSGDPFTMLLMAVPLQLLYEISTAVAWYWEWKDRRKAKPPAE